MMLLILQCTTNAHAGFRLRADHVYTIQYVATYELVRCHEGWLEVGEHTANPKNRAPLVDHTDGDGPVQYPELLGTLKGALNVDAKSRDGRSVGHLVRGEVGLVFFGLRRHDQVVTLKREIRVHIEALIRTSNSVGVDHVEESAHSHDGGIGYPTWIPRRAK